MLYFRKVYSLKNDHIIVLNDMFRRKLFTTSILRETPITKIYVDGSCIQHSNGNRNSGIGVYWGDNDSRNISLKLSGKLKNYVVKSVNEWIHKWKENGWKKANGKKVMHKELIIELDSLINSTGTKFHHVRGHSKIDGNEKAHILAFNATKSC
uniref:ribonuclease H n=1 Tax=Strongyloides stercoralis TaxID=6248 RepID=A0A0K0EEA9_STRER